MLNYKRKFIIWWTKRTVYPYTNPKLRALLRENKRISKQLGDSLKEYDKQLSAFKIDFNNLVEQYK